LYLCNSTNLGGPLESVNDASFFSFADLPLTEETAPASPAAIFDEAYTFDFQDSDIDFEKHLGIVDDLCVPGLYQGSPLEDCQSEVWQPTEPGASSKVHRPTASTQEAAICQPFWIDNYRPSPNSETILNNLVWDDQKLIMSNLEQASLKPIRNSPIIARNLKAKSPPIAPPMAIKSHSGQITPHIRRKTSANLEPRHSCPHCDKYDGEKAFKRRDHLVQHLRTLHSMGHEDLVPGFCPDPNCNLSEGLMGEMRAFKTFRDYADHLRREHKWSLFECNFPGCNRKGEKGYSGMANLINHKKKKHKIMENYIGYSWVPWAFRAFEAVGVSVINHANAI